MILKYIACGEVFLLTCEQGVVLAQGTAVLQQREKAVATRWFIIGIWTNSVGRGGVLKARIKEFAGMS